MSEFSDAFFETLLWSSNDNADDSGGEPLDKNYSVEDIDPHCRAALQAECDAFEAEHGEAIDGADVRTVEYNNRERAGHDFALTRNHHGAGFWDGAWPEPLGATLTEASREYREVDLYVGDDGKLYASGYEQPQFYECGICGAYHRRYFDGDCREDGARFTAEGLDAKYPGWAEVPMPGSEHAA